MKRIHVHYIGLTLLCSILLFSSLDYCTSTTYRTWHVTNDAELEYAFENAHSYDTIIIGTGTYHPSTNLDVANRSLTICGAGRQKTIIDGRNTVDDSDFLLGRDNHSNQSVEYVTIQGLCVQYSDDEGIELGCVADVLISDCLMCFNDNDGANIQNPGLFSSITCESCAFMDNNDDGSDITACGNVTMSDCIASGNGDDGMEIQYGPGYVCQTSSHIAVVDCETYHNRNDGIRIHDITYSSITISRCMSHGQIDGNGFSVFLIDSTPIDVSRCMSYGNKDTYPDTPYGEGHGFFIETDGGSASVINSIAYENEGSGYYIDNDNAQTALALSNCTSHANTYGIQLSNDGTFTHYEEWGASPMLVTNCVCSENDFSLLLDVAPDDPMFDFPTVSFCDLWDEETEAHGFDVLSYFGDRMMSRDPEYVFSKKGDLGLSASSPLIDSGTDTSAPAYGTVVDDFTGRLRPKMHGYDIGAYEYFQAFSPATFTSLVISALYELTRLWNEVSADGGLGEGSVAALDTIQQHMAVASSLGNPVAALGALEKALVLIRGLGV